MVFGKKKTANSPIRVNIPDPNNPGQRTTAVARPGNDVVHTSNGTQVKAFDRGTPLDSTNVFGDKL